MPFALNADTLRKVHLKEFYRIYFDENIRPDGRLYDKSRKTVINLGSINTAHGSSLVRTGETMCICGVTAELFNKSSTVNAVNFVVTNVDISPIASATLMPGPPSDMAQVLSFNIHSIISEIIDPEEELVIRDRNGNPSDYYYVLYVDIFCLCDDGNIFDASLIAATSALSNLKVPKYYYEEKDEKDSNCFNSCLVDDGDFKSISLSFIPFSVSMAIMDGDKFLFDPNSEEEELALGSITIVMKMVDEKPVLLSMSKSGKAISSVQLMNCIKDSERRIMEINNTLKKAIKKVSK
jgi:exosome complex component RRP43